MINPLSPDLYHILTHTEGLWAELRGRSIFITGGTGFVGCWLLESFAWANDQLGLGARALVLTRDVAAFQKKTPHLASHPAIQFLKGDVRAFDFPQGEFPYIIHAATETNTQLTNPDALTLYDVSVQGTRRVLEFARACRAEKMLLTSSGAVYGRQPPELLQLPEDYTGAPDTVNTRSAYGQGKRASEFLCAAFAELYGLKATIARCFAFVGPYLPLDSGYAIGNFIRDALAGGPIRIHGDGTPYRSYLYAADMAIWLWTILFKGQSSRPYNVGAETAVTIAELAQEIATQVAPQAQVQVAGVPGPGRWPERYVPSTDRARRELGLDTGISLPEAIRRTAIWNRLASQDTGGANR